MLIAALGLTCFAHTNRGCLFKRDASQRGLQERVMTKNNLRSVVSLLGTTEIFIPEVTRDGEARGRGHQDSLSIFSTLHALCTLSHLVFMTINEVLLCPLHGCVYPRPKRS